MRELWSNFKRSWLEHMWMQLATLSVLAGTFTVVAVFMFLHSNSSRLLAEWGQEVQLMVYLKDGTSQESVASVKKFLTDLDTFEQIRFVDKAAAAAEFQEKLGSYAPNLLSDKNFGNPLPDSFELKLTKDGQSYGRFDRLSDLAAKIKSVANVEEVSYGQGWVENYASFVETFEMSSLFLVFVLLAGSLFIVGNSIRSSIFERREEIEVLELVGATSGAIRRPFIFEGAMMGGVAALIALFGTYALYLVVRKAFFSEMGFWSLLGRINFLSLQQSITLILIGAVFGALGAHFCVRRLATGWAAAERAGR